MGGIVTYLRLLALITKGIAAAGASSACFLVREGIFRRAQRNRERIGLSFAITLWLVAMFGIACGAGRAERQEPASRSPCDQAKRLEVCYTDDQGELVCHKGER